MLIQEIDLIATEDLLCTDRPLHLFQIIILFNPHEPHDECSRHIKGTVRVKSFKGAVGGGPKGREV